MLAEVAPDWVQDAVRMVQELVVGQTQNDEARRPKPGAAAAASQGLGVVRGAIRLDDQSRLLAEEVDDEGSDGMLSTELGLHDLPALQHAPKLLFRRCGGES